MGNLLSRSTCRAVIVNLDNDTNGARNAANQRSCCRQNRQKLPVFRPQAEGDYGLSAGAGRLFQFACEGSLQGFDIGLHLTCGYFLVSRADEAQLANAHGVRTATQWPGES